MEKRAPSLPAYRPIIFQFSKGGSWLLLMSGLLYLALFNPFDSLVVRSLLLAQYGMFWLWQPLIRPGYRMDWRGIVAISTGGVCFLAWGDWWMVALWIALVISLYGGQGVPARFKWRRRFRMGLLLYWLILLLVWVVPHLTSDVRLPQWGVTGLRWGLPLGLLLLALLPDDPPRRERASNDFFYSLLLLLVIVVAVLGTLAARQLFHLEHLEALAGTLLWLGGLLLLLGWLWNPRAGFAGIGTLWSAGILRLGSPFEQWSSLLAELGGRGGTSRAFLESAASALQQLPAISGGEWRCGNLQGVFGEMADHVSLHQKGELSLTLYADTSVAPALKLHFQLATELLYQFYLSKRREEQLAEQTYIAAVHETGARLTHDIKNLLQSMKALCSVAESVEDPTRLQALYARQLPEITRRLETTLDKLTKPQPDQLPPRPTAAGQWFASFAARYANHAVEFLPCRLRDADWLDAALFDSIADNLIQNALHKQAARPEISIKVALEWKGAIVLTVQDSGEAIAAGLLERLFNAPVSSATGFGLGLHQSANLARSRGATLALASNRYGEVMFSLAAPPISHD